MLKKLLLIPFSVFVCAQNLDAHFRTGIDVSLIGIHSDLSRDIGTAATYILPQITAELKKKIDHQISFGLCGSYTPMIQRTQSFHAFNIGLNSYLQRSNSNTLGLSLNIQHIPLDSFRQVVSGYLNNVSIGALMQGTVTENIYTHFEVRYDITQDNYRPWSFYTPSAFEGTSLDVIHISNFSNYATSIAIGYKLPLDE